jgi:hypothetical protein
MVDVEIIIHNILINLADSFPQAAASGGTPRMRDAIIDISRVDDPQNDFLVANDIKISKYMQLEKG